MMTTQLEDLQARLARLGRPHTPADVAAAMRDLDMVVTDRSLIGALESLRRHSSGAGPLEDLLREPGVSDVIVNGTEGVFVDRGRGLEPVELRIGGEEEVRRLAIRLASSVGRRLDDAQPFVDGKLADGTRLHAVLAPIAAPGTLISLRVPAGASMTLEDLAERGSLGDRGREILAGVIRRRMPFLISGGTGSGKTTLLSAMLTEVPENERIVVVEDARELNPNHAHCVRLEARPPNAEGAGAIPMTHLVRQALRMRPDRVVVGEVRGAELSDLLTALNTGHEGGCGTVHANSIHDIPARLEALAALGGLSREACHAQVAAALKVVIQVRRRENGQRQLGQVGVFQRDRAGMVHVREAARFDDGRMHPGAGWADLASLVGVEP